MAVVQTKIQLLHLRHAAGSGGGPDTVLPFKLRLLDRERFCSSVAYLKNRGEDITPIALSLRAAGVEMNELCGTRLLDLGQLYRLHRLIRAKRIDILHCHEPKSDLYGLLLKVFNPRLTIVSTLHGWIDRSRKSSLYNALDCFCLRFFKLRIAVSSATRKQAAGFGLKNVVLLRNGVDADYWQAMRPAPWPAGSRRQRIGFAGRFSVEKGVADFVRVAQLITAEYPDCEFLLAGEGPEAARVQKLVAELGLDGQVRFLGMLDKAAMKDFYQQLDLLLLTSYTEGLPNVVLQALSMELPVVATRVGGVAELILAEQTGLLSEAGEVAGLARQSLRLLRDPHLAQELGRRGRQRILAEFSMQERVRRLEQLYLGLLERG